jgi:cobalt-zinc-cadmium efflux system outer membrane protein
MMLATRPASAEGERLVFNTYLQRVLDGNLDLAAQRANVSVAEAQIGIAKVFPDPQLTGGISQYDLVQNGNNPTGTVVSLNVPLQIGGQRSARVTFAQAGLSAAQADLQEFLRGLRADAANAYIESLHARLVLDRRKLTLSSLERLVTVNEERVRAGDIGEVQLLQSRVEASQFRASVVESEGSVRTADLTLVQLAGRGASALLTKSLTVDGNLQATADRTFDTAALVRRAEVVRPDLIAARRRLNAAEKQIDLAKANRVIDVSVGAYWSHYFPLAGAQPSAELVGASVTVPIPFSRLYRGELDTAYATREQASAATSSVGVKVEIEVRQAVAKYEAASARVKLYTGGVLTQADQVLEKTLYNYQRGGATLVEVLVAQRTDNEVHLSYFDALADAAHALVAVEQAVGSWDINF